METTEIKVLTACHSCRKVFNGPPELTSVITCPNCSSNRLYILLDMTQVFQWIKDEDLLEKAKKTCTWDDVKEELKEESVP